MDTCLLVDQGLTLRECSLCFVWSRTTVVDEVGSFKKVEALTFVDFLEALARLADYVETPSREQLQKFGWGSNILAYWVAKQTGSAGGAGGDDVDVVEQSESMDESEKQGTLIPADQIKAGKQRDLSVNLELLIDLMARALHYRKGTHPFDTFSFDETVSMLRKIDKSNGT